MTDEEKLNEILANNPEPLFYEAPCTYGLSDELDDVAPQLGLDETYW